MREATDTTVPEQWTTPGAMEGGRVGYFLSYDERGLPVATPDCIDPVVVGGETFPTQWHDEQKVRDLGRELDGVQQKLALGPDAFTFPGAEPATAQRREAWQRDLEGTRDFIVAELKRLDGAVSKPKSKPKKKRRLKR